jgi:hypothetical protein
MPDWGVEPREVWASEQLTRAKLPDALAGPVLRLLKSWWDIHHDPAEAKNILHTFTELAQQHSLELPDDGQFVWVPVKPGQIRVSEIVRVKPSAFTGELGEMHNGRVCRVVAIRSGDIIVNSIDGGPRFEGTHYSPFALDKRVPA